MIENNNNTDRAKEEALKIKKEIEEIIQRVHNIRDKSPEILREQLEHLGDVISSLKKDGEKKGKEILGEVVASTRTHPLRNLGYAFGIGILISLFIKK